MVYVYVIDYWFMIDIGICICILNGYCYDFG